MTPDKLPLSKIELKRMSDDYFRNGSLYLSKVCDQALMAIDLKEENDRLREVLKSITIQILSLKL